MSEELYSEGMQPLDEIDLRVIEALTVKPRASWASIGAALDISPSTAARRWDQLRAQRIAWMSCYAGPGFSDEIRILEIHVACLPGRLQEVGRALQDSRVAVSLSSIAGEWDLVVNTQTHAGDAGVEALLSDPVWAHPGIRKLCVSPWTRGFGDGVDWRVGALAPAQAAGLAGHRETRSDHVPTRAIVDILRLLREDPRMSASHLAQHLHTSVATISRQLETLLRTGGLVVRTEVSSQVAGWSSGGYLYFDVPPASLEAAGRYVAQLPNTRLSMSVLNPHWNLSTVHWVNRPDQLHGIEADIRQHFPEARVASRATRIRELKRVGWILDEQHRPSRHVPVEVEN